MFVPALGGHDVACDFCRKHRCDEPMMFYMKDTGAAICYTCIAVFTGRIASTNTNSKKPVLAFENQPVQFTLNKSPSTNGESA